MTGNRHPPLLRRGIAAAVLAIAGVGAGCTSDSDPAYLRVRGPAPAIRDAPPTRALLVTFWASWCEPCRFETPDLLDLAARPPEGMGIVTFSHDEGLAEVEEFLGGSPAPQLHLRLDSDRAAARAFGVDSLPTTFLLVDGQLAARFNGPRHWNSSEMRRLLGRLLGPTAAAGADDGIMEGNVNGD